MKGTLINFKKKVNNKIEAVYKSYISDFQVTIGDLLKEKEQNREEEYSHKSKDFEIEL